MKNILFIAIVATSIQAFAGQDIVKPKAEAPHWSETLLEVFSLVPEIIIEGQIPVEAHGHYCGPFHGDGTYVKDPIDSIDAACKAHDFCYDVNFGGRYLDCACDAKLVNSLFENVDQVGALSFRAMAVGAGMIGWFSESTCFCKQPNGVVRKLVNPSFYEKNQCV